MDVDVKKNIQRMLGDKAGEYTPVGRHLLMRRFGSTNNFQISSSVPGTNGMVDIIVLESELADYLTAFSELSRIASARQRVDEPRKSQTTVNPARAA